MVGPWRSAVNHSTLRHSHGKGTIAELYLSQFTIVQNSLFLIAVYHKFVLCIHMYIYMNMCMYIVHANSTYGSSFDLHMHLVLLSK